MDYNKSCLGEKISGLFVKISRLWSSNCYCIGLRVW